MAAAVDLVQLIDLSLGSEPCGVVNFNYLHGLLHEIVKRLVQVESGQSSVILGEGLAGYAPGAVQPRGSVREGGGRPAGDVTAISGGAKATPGASKESKTPSGEATTPADAKRASDEAKTTQDAAKPPSDEAKTSQDATKSPTDGAITKSASTVSKVSSSGTTGAGGGSSEASTEDTAGELPSMARSYSGVSSGRRSRAGLVVSAANDLSALERKLHDLELRFNTMETLPELLKRKSSDLHSTPVSDMWHFTNIDKRLGATEEGLDKVFGLVDDLLGELQGVKAQVEGLDQSVSASDNKLSAEMRAIEDKLKELEALKLAAAKESMGDAATALLSELQNKINTLQSDTDGMKKSQAGYVTSSQLEEAMAHTQEQLNAQADTLARTEGSLKDVSDSMSLLEGKVKAMGEELDALQERINKAEVSISKKVDAADLSSLMPSSDSGEAASLMPTLIELQGKMSQMEAKLGTVPTDVLDQMKGMQTAIDSLSADLSSLSAAVAAAGGGGDRSKLEELGSVVAQLRERMAEIDRAVTALSNAVSSSRKGAEPEEEEAGASFVDTSDFEALREAMSALQQEHERLIGTAAHLSHELDVSKEHVKSLYGGVDELRESKADKQLVEVEVREKADRSALEGKASRDWVDSTFERLDQQIREASSKLMGQQEAFRSAMSQINEDVEGKLDRMELQPLKDYFDKKLDRVKTAPVFSQPTEAMVDDAAGFKKPLRFRCISCDKPVGIKPLAAIPALPSIQTFPGNRSFRPYTTYELEYIRRHQRTGYPLSNTPLNMARSVRSAGGCHTLTKAHQRIRVAPLSSTYTPEPYAAPSTRSPSTIDEQDVMGHDGHIYKGRASVRTRLPPLAKPKSEGRQRQQAKPLSEQQTVMS